MNRWLLLVMLSCVQFASAAPPTNAAGFALLSEAERMFAQGDNLRALSLYQAIVEQDRNNPQVWLRLGELYQRERRTDQALQAYAEVARIYPTADSAPQATDMLARAHLERARLYAQLAQQELMVARDLPASDELQRAITQAHRVLAGTTLVAQARPQTSAAGQTVEIRHVSPGVTLTTKPGIADIQIIRGSGSHPNSLERRNP